MASQETWFENPNVGQRSRIVTLPGETGRTPIRARVHQQALRGEHAVPPHVHNGGIWKPSRFSRAGRVTGSAPKHEPRSRESGS